MRRSITALLAAAVTVGGGLAGAASGSLQRAGRHQPGVARPATHGFTVTLTKMRGRRYCELFLIKRAAGGALFAQVWNTYTHGSCPQAQWTALDLAQLATQTGSLGVLRNGPRYWLINGLEKFDPAGPPTRTFGRLKMSLAATIKLGTVLVAPKPYRRHQVSRNTIFRYAARARVYELLAADGSRYVMQSWSRQIDPHLGESGLEHLATRLHLPSGWRYRARTLQRPLEIDTARTPAIVLQDDLDNSYSLEPAAHARR